MHQDIGFFDVTQIGELTSRMTQDCQQVVDQAYLNVTLGDNPRVPLIGFERLKNQNGSSQCDTFFLTPWCCYPIATKMWPVFPTVSLLFTKVFMTSSCVHLTLPTDFRQRTFIASSFCPISQPARNVFLRTLVSIITTLAFMFSITTPLTCVAFVSVPAVVQISMKFSNTFREISDSTEVVWVNQESLVQFFCGNEFWDPRLVGTKEHLFCCCNRWRGSEVLGRCQRSGQRVLGQHVPRREMSGLWLKVSYYTNSVRQTKKVEQKNNCPKNSKKKEEKKKRNWLSQKPFFFREKNLRNKNNTVDQLAGPRCGASRPKTWRWNASGWPWGSTGPSVGIRFWEGFFGWTVGWWVWICLDMFGYVWMVFVVHLSQVCWWLLFHVSQVGGGFIVSCFPIVCWFANVSWCCSCWWPVFGGWCERNDMGELFDVLFLNRLRCWNIEPKENTSCFSRGWRKLLNAVCLAVWGSLLNSIQMISSKGEWYQMMVSTLLSRYNSPNKSVKISNKPASCSIVPSGSSWRNGPLTIWFTSPPPWCYRNWSQPWSCSMAGNWSWKAPCIPTTCCPSCSLAQNVLVVFLAWKWQIRLCSLRVFLDWKGQQTHGVEIVTTVISVISTV